MLDDMVPADVAAAASIDETAREEQLREELARPWSRVRVARGPDGELLGFAVYWHVVDEIHVINVVVDAARRRRGIGRWLMEDLLLFAREKGATRVLLEVRAGNAPAQALYAAFGFRTFNVRRAYYADGEDALEMELAL